MALQIATTCTAVAHFAFREPPLVEFGFDPASLGAVGFQFRHHDVRELRRGLLWSSYPCGFSLRSMRSLRPNPIGDERSSGRTGEAAWQTSPAPEHNLGAWALAHTRLGFPRLGLSPGRAHNPRLQDVVPKNV